MKKLLLSISILAFTSVFSQNQSAKPSGIFNMSEKLARKFSVLKNVGELKKANPVSEISPGEAVLKTVNTTAATWQVIGTSMNIHGMLISQSRPLQYNDNLNAVSFIHRKGNTYNAQPFSNTGAVVARISTNWGASWDSTCIWSNNSNFAQSAQGAIYNPPGNTNVLNSYIVGSGPVTTGTAITGSWYASKKSGTINYNATASSTLNAQQFFSNTPPYTSLGKHDSPRYSFTSTDDGKVRSLGIITNDINNPNNAGYGFRGAMITNGTFNAGVFSWTGDSIIPNTVLRTDGTKQIYDKPIMAWNENGNIGYVVFIGSATSGTLSNQGWQPIVFKTSNSGFSWSYIPGIDFNSPTMLPIKSHINSVNTNTNLTIPFFNVNEGFDAIIDNTGKLHIVSTIIGTASQHNDSLDYTYQFGAEKYCWPHTPGKRPYLYDFVGDGSGPWTYKLIDSLSTEAPGSSTIDPGYNDNPWDADPTNNNSKVTSDARIQLSRTASGEGILYTWSESDTNFTVSQKKWNNLPNIKARYLESYTNYLSSTKINITKPLTGSNLNISNRAMFHYTSSTHLSINCAGYVTTIKVPISISNNNQYFQSAQNQHWFSAANLVFNGLCIDFDPGGIKNNLVNTASSFKIYPNPANSNTTLAIDLKEEGNVSVNIFNTIGQLVKTINTKGQLGENKMNIELNNIPSGIYLVNVKVGNTTSTKKLIVE